MAGIFISYRRIDTIAWAGRLFADLVKRFGALQVFMDINGGIARGALFEDVLRNALSGCNVLLVLIGPQWAGCKRSDGRRRLEIPDDWVRAEVATSLGRGIIVVPVLLGKALLPEESDLPGDLLTLRKRNAAEISDTRWDYDVGELIKDVVKLSALKPVDDVVSAETGIRLLKDLIIDIPAVADAVGRSREVLENTHRQIGKLDLFKTIHDALHTIEFECLRPMQAGGSRHGVRPFKIRFGPAARRIQDSVKEGELNPALRDDLLDQLELAGAAFQDAVNSPGDAAYGRVVAELNMLLSSVPSRLDTGIADAAAELSLDRLIELMTALQSKLPAVSATRDVELEPFIQGVEALQRLREELGRRVAEHSRLQRLDSKLRTVCVGGAAPGTVASEWARIKLVRARLTPPFSPEVEDVKSDLAANEAEIESAVAEGDERVAVDLIKEYFRSVSSVFRVVDAGLLEFCMRLGSVSQPLKMVLSMCQ